MPVSDEILVRAKVFNRLALEELLADVYPAVHRIALALTGRKGAGRQVVHEVIRQSLRVIPTWRVGISPENWYYHHTLLTARTASMPPADPTQDILVTIADSPDTTYTAFVKAIRQMPRQQAEAFLLHHGEKLNSRLLGVAMDCSMNAAAIHLRAATDELAGFSADDFQPLTAKLEKAYAALSPVDEAIRPAARRYVNRRIRQRRFRGLLRFFIVLSLVCAAAYAGWRWHREIRDLVLRLLEHVHPSAPQTNPAS